MDRTRRLHQIWNWLPAFRVVGESVHLPTASKALGVSAPALSRAIKLLEEGLDVALFDRVGRRLALNDAGQDLLLATRDAMRLLDDAIERITSADLQGPLRLAARAHISWIFCVPVVQALASAHPRLAPEILSLGTLDIVRGLQRGTIDIGLLEEPVDQPDLVIDRLTELSHGIYCGQSHPLRNRRTIDLEALADHGFVVPAGGPKDGWPPERRRRVGARVAAFADAVALCEAGHLLAVLPDRIAQTDLLRGRLQRLPIDALPTTPVYVLHRRPVGQHRRVAAALTCLTDVR